MKFPLFVLPNLENLSDIQMLDADNRSLTATEFSNAIGGIKSLRLMVGDASIFNQKPQTTSQATLNFGVLFCIAFPSGTDSSNRITSGAVILREVDSASFYSDTRLWELACKAGIDEERRNLVANEIEEIKFREAHNEKKKPHFY